MRIGVTVRFQNSYFSGATPQVACALARALAAAGHTVELVYPKGESDWFIDNTSYKTKLPPRVQFNPATKYDNLVEVVWHLNADERAVQSRVIYFVHYPPIFHDMESCVYPVNLQRRAFKNVSAIWTYDHYSKHDVEYLEFLSEAPVHRLPYCWDPEALDLFVTEYNIPEWADSARHSERAIPADFPPSMSWCLRVFESNFSNSSHCIIPLTIISEIRKTAEPVRFAVHNAECTSNNEFFKNNVVKNLLLPDISGAMVPRIRLPEIRREKAILLSHQRWRPLKSFLLDAAYLGIPTIHNNAILKACGSPYFYELNQIREAVQQYKTLAADYVGNKGFFAPGTAAVRQGILRARFSPNSVKQAYNTALTPIQLSRPLPTIQTTKPPVQTELRLGFAEMWENFQPEHNFFTYLLKWMGSLSNIKVVVDHVSPNLVFWGPLSNGTENRWPGIPKIYFTGENSRAVRTNNTFLNIGFDYDDPSPDYVRLPLWVLEVNWFGGNVDVMKNPRPVSLLDATTTIKKPRSKFCAFVASNPNNPVRNATFDMIHRWRPVDSGGRLFCNLPAPIPAGLGGGGGELAKVNFYKDYKFVLAMENSSREGYVTEKLFHAKVAGAVPIYWGDRWADRDFDKKGFLNITEAKTPQEVLAKIAAVDDNAWEEMTAIPAVTPYKKAWCQHTMVFLANKIFKAILDKTVTVLETAWESSTTFAAALTPIITVSSDKKSRIYVTAANKKFVEAAVNAVKSFRQTDKTTKCIVYLWPDVDDTLQELLKTNGADELRMFPTNAAPWPDFWEPQHYAWKLWLHKTLLDELEEGTCFLYVDSGAIFVREPTELWAQIEKHGIMIVNDPGQPNSRWCHPEFCRILNVKEAELNTTQILGGIIGYRKGAYDSLAQEALRIGENREAIVGNKWTPYSATCMGHRHDQSILSILTQRYAVPRLQLDDVYCDTSLRAAQQFNTPLYVHRGHFKAFAPFTQGIDELYVINLARRKDRLDSWRKHHMDLKHATYVLPATDGRTLQLTPSLVECFRNNDFKWKKSVMGCALSHLTLWEKLAMDQEATSYLIMEDDVRFTPQWLNQWKTMAGSIPADADVIYLGGVLPPNKPALPIITENVNPFFARVAANTLYGPQPRRYFHFCNYSYVLTQQGARKLVSLVKQRGIFTSGDHMIVNHGDDYLKIYFTTPLLSTCFQEDDPVYQKSEFNNFSRVDNFDSDLWNNTDCFSEAEINAAKSGQLNAVEQRYGSEQKAKEQKTKEQKPEMPSKEDHIKLWNQFLQTVAMKKETDLPTILRALFSQWTTMDVHEFTKHLGWFRIFEQFIMTDNEVLIKQSTLILELMKTQSDKALFFTEILKKLNGTRESTKPSVTTYSLPSRDVQTIFHIPHINLNVLETDWLTTLYGKPVVWKPLMHLEELVQDPNPTILYQNDPSKAQLVNIVYKALSQDIKMSGVKITLLHLSDEFCADDISFYDAYTKVIRTYVRKDLPSNVTVIPLGYANGRSNRALDTPPSWADRPHLWSFVGSMDRPGRADALSALQKAAPFLCKTKENWSAPNAQEGPDYIDTLRKSKFVPCFAGSSALESYRLYEALEHGAIPFYVTDKDEYELLFPKRPFLRFDSWEQAAGLLPQLAPKSMIMETQREACADWWSKQKVALAQKMI